MTPVKKDEERMVMVQEEPFQTVQVPILKGWVSLEQTFQVDDFEPVKARAGVEFLIPEGVEDETIAVLQAQKFRLCQESVQDELANFLPAKAVEKEPSPKGEENVKAVFGDVQELEVAQAPSITSYDEDDDPDVEPLQDQFAEYTSTVVMHGFYDSWDALNKANKQVKFGGMVWPSGSGTWSDKENRNNGDDKAIWSFCQKRIGNGKIKSWTGQQRKQVFDELSRMVLQETGQSLSPRP